MWASTGARGFGPLGGLGVRSITITLILVVSHEPSRVDRPTGARCVAGNVLDTLNMPVDFTKKRPFANKWQTPFFASPWPILRPTQRTAKYFWRPKAIFQSTGIWSVSGTFSASQRAPVGLSTRDDSRETANIKVTDRTQGRPVGRNPGPASVVAGPAPARAPPRQDARRSIYVRFLVRGPSWHTRGRLGVAEWWCIPCLKGAAGRVHVAAWVVGIIDRGAARRKARAASLRVPVHRGEPQPRASLTARRTQTPVPPRPAEAENRFFEQQARPRHPRPR